MAKAHDVASYLLDRCGSLTTYELHKLLYYCDGWSLAWDKKPLISEPFEAWVHGPVVRRLFAVHAGRPRLMRGDLRGDHAALTQEQLETIDAVLGFYGDLGAEKLEALSHREIPWIEARGDAASSERSSEIIDREDMARFFSNLAESIGARAKELPSNFRDIVDFWLDFTEDEVREMERPLENQEAQRFMESLCLPGS